MIHKNEVTLVGNLGRDAVLQTFSNGDQILSFSMATNKEYTDRDGNTQSITNWHNVVLKGKQVAYVKDRLKKGTLVYVNGELRSRPYSKDNNIMVSEVVGTAYLLEMSRRESAPEGDYSHG